MNDEHKTEPPKMMPTDSQPPEQTLRARLQILVEMRLRWPRVTNPVYKSERRVWCADVKDVIKLIQRVYDHKPNVVHAPPPLGARIIVAWEGEG